MKVVELILDEEKMAGGVEAISVVENPAIESNFVTLSSERMEFRAMNEEKKILLGALLIPEKRIPRNQELNGKVQQFMCYFSAETIEKASQLFLKKGNQANATLEHQMSVQGLTLVESWIKVDRVHDKSVAFGLNEPVGTWFGAIKVDNEELWNNFVKTGKVKGFSIEGFFADRSVKMTRGLTDAEKALNEIAEILKREK